MGCFPPMLAGSSLTESPCIAAKALRGTELCSVVQDGKTLYIPEESSAVLQKSKNTNKTKNYDNRNRNGKRDRNSISNNKVNKTTRQQDNKTTKQRNNKTTKQPHNRAYDMPNGLLLYRTGASWVRSQSPSWAILCYSPFLH